jgi:hypothetical protein
MEACPDAERALQRVGVLDALVEGAAGEGEADAHRNTEQRASGTTISGFGAIAFAGTIAASRIRTLPIVPSFTTFSSCALLTTARYSSFATFTSRIRRADSSSAVGRFFSRPSRPARSSSSRRSLCPTAASAGWSG